MPFPHWALWCFKHSAAAESPPGAQRGPHHIQFVKEPRLGTFMETHRATRLSHTPQKCPPPATPLFPLFIFLQLRQAFLSGDPTFDSSARLQVARRRGLPRVCELFRCQSLAVFSQKPQGKEKCCHRRTAAG